MHQHALAEDSSNPPQHRARKTLGEMAEERARASLLLRGGGVTQVEKHVRHSCSQTGHGALKKHVRLSC